VVAKSRRSGDTIPARRAAAIVRSMPPRWATRTVAVLTERAKASRSVISPRPASPS
jgi:hypothetical protein